MRLCVRVRVCVCDFPEFCSIQLNVPCMFSSQAPDRRPSLGNLCWSCWSRHYNLPHWSHPQARNTGAKRLAGCTWTNGRTVSDYDAKVDV